MPINIAALKHKEGDVIGHLQSTDDANINFFNSAQNLLKQKQSLPVQMLKEKIMLAHHLELLQKLVDHFNKRFDNTASLAAILANNWHQYKNTLCGYTAQPTSDVTLLLCDIAEYLATKTGKSAIHFLMPGVSTESISKDIPNLDEKGIALRTVLKSHILSESGSYLYPVRMLSALACESESESQKVPNPYFDYAKGPENEAFVPSLALKQMLNHSADTQAIEDAKSHFQSLLQPTNLFGQIHLLIKILRMNGKSGIGSEEFASARAYEGIISFNHYYQTLNEAQKKTIPQDVKDQIELLINLSSNPQQNNNGMQNLQTCIDTRQAKLAEVIKKHEAALINIGTDDKTKATMLTVAREAFQTCQKQLLHQCTQGTYVGKDKLKISKALVEDLKIPVILTSEADLQDFLSLTVSDIQSLLENNKALRNQLLGQLNNLEALILFTSQAPIEQMNKIIHLVGNKLPKPEIEEFSVWLEMLELKRFEIVLSVFQDSMINTVKDLRLTLQHLSVGKCNALFSELKNRVWDLIQTANNVLELLLPLGIEQRAVVFEAIKDRLAKLIKTPNHIGDVLLFLSAKQRAVVFDAIKDRLPGLIKTPNDVGRVLEYLSAEQRAVVFEAIKNRLPKLIKTADDVVTVLRDLSVEQRTVVLAAIKNRLPKLIKTADDASKVLSLLTLEQITAMLEAIKDRLAHLVQTTSDVIELFRYLNAEQRVRVFEVIKDRLSQLIQTSDAVGEVFRCFEDEQRTVLFEAIKDRLANLMQTAADVGNVLDYLSIEQSVLVLQIIKNRLPNLMQTAADVKALFIKLNLEKLAVVFEVIKECLVNLIKTADDVQHVLSHLTVEQCALVLKAIQDRLPNLIKNANDVNDEFTEIGFDKRAMIITALKEAQAALADVPVVPQSPLLLQNYQRHLSDESQKEKSKLKRISQREIASLTLDEACLPGSGKRRRNDDEQPSSKKRRQ